MTPRTGCLLHKRCVIPGPHNTRMVDDSQKAGWMIWQPSSKSAVLYLLAFILPLPFYLSGILQPLFSQDEFQHTYLAWAWIHFDQLPYRDVFDNHGIVHTLVNVLTLRLLPLEPGAQTLIQLRLVNLCFLYLCFIPLFKG